MREYRQNWDKAFVRCKPISDVTSSWQWRPYAPLHIFTFAKGKSYTWDFENRLVSAVVPGTGTVTFKYDPFGKGVYKSWSTFTGIFLYDNDNLIETMNASGTEISSYTQTQNIDEPLAELRGSTSDYYEAAGVGSITSLSGSAGALANTYTYDSFGSVTNLTGTLKNPFLYTAREFDQETGIYEYRARYYNPTAGRFISEAPIRFKGGIDFYAYVKNRPLSFVDPTGTCFLQLDFVSHHFIACSKGLEGDKCGCMCAVVPGDDYPKCLDACKKNCLAPLTPKDLCLCGLNSARGAGYQLNWWQLWIVTQSCKGLK